MTPASTNSRVKSCFRLRLSMMMEVRFLWMKWCSFCGPTGMSRISEVYVTSARMSLAKLCCVARRSRLSMFKYFPAWTSSDRKVKKCFSNSGRSPISLIFLRPRPVPINSGGMPMEYQAPVKEMARGSLVLPTPRL